MRGLTTQNGFERLACEVFQDQRQASAFIDQRERFGNASDIQRLKQQVFALETSGLGCVGVFRKELQKHRHPIRQAAGTVEVRARCRADPINGLTIRDDHCPPLSAGDLARHLHVAFPLLNEVQTCMDVDLIQNDHMVTATVYN